MFTHVWPSQAPALKVRVVAALSCLVGAKLLNVQVPFFFKHAIDSFQLLPALDSAQNALITGAGAFVIGYGAARLGTSLFNELRTAIFSKVAQTSVRNLTKRCFVHLHSLDLSFHLSRDTGGLSRALDRGTRAISFLLNAIVFNLLPTFLEVSLVTGILTYKCGPEYGALSIATIILYSIYTLSVTQWRNKFRIEMNHADNRAGKKSMDSLINYETIKYCNAEQLEAKQYDALLAEYQTASLKTMTSLSTLNFGQSTIFSVALTSMMLMAVGGINAGVMTPGDLVMVNGLLFQLSLPLNFLGTVYREIRQSFIDMNNMFNLLSIKPAIQSLHAPSLVITPQTSAVLFDNVSFGYTPDNMVLNKVSLEIPSEKKVALVGGSGCGKSTVVRMLYRFYDCTEGAIKINNQDIREVSLESLRASIAVVPQDTVLFHDSIYYNIAYGRQGASQSEVYKASQLAGLHTSITNMPDSYITAVGERGLKLSGGEKQRVAIARMFLKQAHIQIFDEATSSLDSITESHILSTIKSGTQRRTTLFIAHRLSTIQDADIIYVMDNNTIVEYGTHYSLISRDTLYRYLWENQNSYIPINTI